MQPLNIILHLNIIMNKSLNLIFMKRKNNYYLFIIGLLITFTACSNDDFNEQSDFEKSLNAFRSFKRECNDTYQYKVTGSTWVGVSWHTVITVKEGKVIQRAFKYDYIRDEFLENMKEEQEWVENEDEICSHENYPAAAAINMDEVYDLAKNKWLQKKEHTELFFETDNHGMISLCGYRDVRCTDDCFRGISIESITPVL